MYRRRLLLNLIIISACLFVIFTSLSNIFLRVKARPVLQEKLAAALKRKTEIGSVHLSLKGITIRDLVIWNVKNEHPLYHFKELKIKPSIHALIFQQKLKFRSELSPTKNFKAQIDAIGSYNFKTSDLSIQFRLKNVPYIEDIGTLYYGTARLYRKPDLKKDEKPVDLLDITITSPKILLVAKSSIINNNGKTEIRGRIIAPFIKTNKYHFNNIDSEVALIGDKLYFYHLSAGLHKGAFQMDCYIDLDNPMPPFSINANVNDMNMHDFSTNSTIFKRKISGICNANIKLKGIIGATNSIYAKSWVEIKEANLWETDFFKGIATVLFIPRLQEVVFTDAFGAIRIKNSRFYTENFKLVSKQMELSLNGSLGFDDTVDADIRIRLKKELIQESAWLSKISSILLESAGWFIGNVKVSGTTKDPVYTVTPVGVGNILNKIKKTIDKVKDILQ